MSCVQSTLLHRADTWTILKADGKRLQAFHMQCQCRFLGNRWSDFVTNSSVTKTTGLPEIAYMQSSVRGGWLSSGTSDACQKTHQHTTSCKCLLNCSPAPHQSLIGGENQEDHKAAGFVVFSRTYSSIHNRPGQRD